VSRRLIEEWEKDGLIRSANVKRPGATRGRKLIDMWSLFDFIEKGVGEPPAKLAMNRATSGSAVNDALSDEEGGAR
jgi:hypothetical protein